MSIIVVMASVAMVCSAWIRKTFQPNLFTIIASFRTIVELVYHSQSRTGHYSPSFRSFSMGQSDPEYSEFGTVLADGGDRFAVSAICFDSQEELLWMGNAGVRVILFLSSFFVYHSLQRKLRYCCRVMSHPISVRGWKSTRHFRFMLQNRCAKY